MDFYKLIKSQEGKDINGWQDKDFYPEVSSEVGERRSNLFKYIIKVKIN